MGIASLVLGLVSVILGMIPIVGYIMIIPAIIGLILGIIAIVKKNRKGLGITGVVLNIIFFIIIIIYSIIFVIAVNDYDSEKSVTRSETTELVEDPSEISKTFGTYNIPEDWKESKELSYNKKYFYIKEGTDMSKPTSNISIEMGTNRYPKSNHIEFRQSIQAQLMMQTSDSENISAIEGLGKNTENGDILYVFTIKEETKNITTRQYYIVGDYKYILVHETDYNDSNIQDVSEVAEKIVNSFKWK